MSNASSDVASILKLFGLFFSNRWTSQWEKDWDRKQTLLAHAQDQPTPPKGQPGKEGQGESKPKPAPCKPPSFYERVFSLRVTLWLLLYQRLNFDTTLKAVVSYVRKGGVDRLGKREREKISQRIRSAHTSSYNDARQRLPLAFVQAALAFAGEKIQDLVGWSTAGKQKPGPFHRTRQLLDGSTLKVLSTPELAREYPPAQGPKGASDWCLMRIVVGFCARSGAVLSAIQAATQVGEQSLAWQLMAQAAPWVIWIGDRNFGIWSILAKARLHDQDALVRLTRVRAKKLMGKKKLRSGQERLIQWAPSDYDKVAPGTEGRVVTGRLIYVRLKRGHSFIDLWLFTTLEAENYPLELLVKWYGQRWQAELHFRSVKTQLGLAELSVETPEMARKEFYAALLGYNLVRAVMWKAGENLENGDQTLSFQNARREVVEWLKDWGKNFHGSANDHKWIQTLVEEVMRQRLPKRKRPRPSQPRMVRSHATHWPILKGSRSEAQKRHAANSKSG